jgi:UPF0755 protein
MNKNATLDNMSNKVNLRKNVLNDGLDTTESTNGNYINLIIRMVLYVICYGLIIFSIVTIANKAYEFAYQVYGDVAVENKATKTKEVEIVPGDSIFNIANKLYNEGLIVNKYSFIVRMKLSDEVVQQGKYKISNDMNYKEIISEITNNTDEE